MTKKDSEWRQAVVYQVYPWTFLEDSKRTPQKGVGSLQGITNKLAYIRDELGADVVWLNPIYPSPMKDAGYDITDYCDIHPDLGKLKDFDELVESAHKLNLKVMIDFVPNHTSDQHEWFQKSRRREEDFEDWYIWHPGKKDKDGKLVMGANGRPEVPNNWACVFSIPNKRRREAGEFPELKKSDWTPPVSAWQWDDERGEYYMRSFSVEQPDLNWSNPRVREEMKKVLRFWLDRGVDGFRLDAVNWIGKNMNFADEQVDEAYNENDYDNPYDQLMRFNSCGYPEALHRYVWEMCEVIRDERYEHRDLRMIMEAHMGESELRELNDIAPDVATTFNFGAMKLKWGALQRRIQLSYYYENLDKDSIGNQVNGNHDTSRIATRLGDDTARAVAVLNLFLPGMKFIYNGEELGLHDADIPHSRMRDHENGFRDAERTPIVWNDNEKNAGFSMADEKDLWLPVNQNDIGISLNHQIVDPLSSFNLYKKAIALTKKLTAAREGRYQSLSNDNSEVFAFERRHEEERLLVAVNFSDRLQHVDITTDFKNGKQIFSSIYVDQHLSDIDVTNGVQLEPNEAIVITAI